jgi:hypothetical protein
VQSRKCGLVLVTTAAAAAAAATTTATIDANVDFITAQGTLAIQTVEVEQTEL